MSERLDALTVRESNGKSYFTKIGVAFAAKTGGGWSVLLDAMPAPTDGQFKILLREPLPPREQGGHGGHMDLPRDIGIPGGQFQPYGGVRAVEGDPLHEPEGNNVPAESGILYGAQGVGDL